MTADPGERLNLLELPLWARGLVIQHGQADVRQKSHIKNRSVPM
jgi:hypothetical protein